MTEYAVVMDDIHKSIEEYHPNKKSKIVMVFDDVMINDMLSNKKLNRIVAELFIKGKKLKICCNTIIFFSYWCSSCIR